jgi:type I restriction enzyme S subunit
MEVKPGYKQTEMGVIPEDWRVKPLPEVCRFRGGKAHEQHISDTGRYVCVNSKFISSDGTVRKYSTANFCPAKKGDVLMVMSDLPNGRALAKAFLVEADDTYAVNQRVCALTAYRDFPGFLFYVLNRSPYFLKFDDGVNQTHLLNPIFQKCPLVLPPTVEEQCTIAEALNDVGALLGALDRLIAKKRDLKQAAMQQILTGQTRLPGFHDEWEVKRLGKSCEVVTKGTTPTSIGRNFVSSGMNFLKAESISEIGDPLPDKVAFIDMVTHKLLKRSQLKEGDLLLSIAGVLGRVGRVSKDILPANTNQALAIIRLGKSSEVEESFLFYCLRSPMTTKQINDVNVQAAQANISLQNVRDLEIHVPPTRAEQTAIAEVLTDMDAELAALEQRREKTRALKQAMMQELLTGRTRLV